MGREQISDDEKADMGLVFPSACGSSGLGDRAAALTLPGVSPKLAVKQIVACGRYQLK